MRTALLAGILLTVTLAATTGFAQTDPVPPPPPPPPPSVPEQQVAPLPPPSPMTGAVLGFVVDFSAKDSEVSYTVSVDGGQSCTVPCQLAVAPGRHEVLVSYGDSSFSEKVNFPAAPTSIRIDHRNGKRLAMGIVGLSIGVPLAVVGGILIAECVYSLNHGGGGNGAGIVLAFGELGGGVLVVAGLVLGGVLGGIGFGTMGRHHLVFDRSFSASEEHTAPVQFLGFGVAPTKGGAVMGATLAF